MPKSEGAFPEDQNKLFSSPDARKIHNQLAADKSGSKGWKQLRDLTFAQYDEHGRPLEEAEVETANEARMQSLREVLPPAEWTFLTERLASISLDSDSVVDYEGVESDGIEVFLDLASDLKEFDPVAFSSQFNLGAKGDTIWRESVEPLLRYYEGEPEGFLDNAANAKVLFPHKFDSGAFEIRPVAWDSAVPLIKKSIKKLPEFLRGYCDAVYLDRQEIEARLPITLPFWNNIRQLVESKGEKTFAHGQLAAFAQAVRPESFPRLKVNQNLWTFYVQAIKKGYDMTSDPWTVLKCSREIKRLELDAVVK